MRNILGDIRYGVRTLAQSPTFTVLTVVTLALAIGVNTAIFSMVNVLMLRPLPIKDTESLAFIYSDNSERGINSAYVSAADFLDYQDQLTSFASLATVNRGRNYVMTGVEEPVNIVGFEVTANTFDVWGVQPLMGRTFVAGEDEIGAERVVLLSHGAWEQRFGADPDILGKTIKLDDFETTIIGVMDPELEFGGLDQAEIWTPLVLDAATADREGRFYWTSGQLREGVTHEQAAQEVRAIEAGLLEQYPESNSGWVHRVEDINGALATDQVWTIFYMLMLTVGFVMLIACSNIATMMLSRATSRTKEIAVRAALGAGRARILRQLLTESLILSVGAALLGLVATRLFLDGLVWMVGQNSGTNFFSLLVIDRNVLLFTGTVALLAPMLFGFFPALRASRTDLSETLKDSSRGSSGGAGLRGRRFLVATQVALALSLMVVAGLLIRTMVNQRIFDLGYETDGILTMRIDLPEGKYPDEHQWLPFFDEVMDRVEALPGIEAAGWVSSRPLAEFDGNLTFVIEGAELPEAGNLPFSNVNVASPGAFDVLGIPVMRGRGFGPADNADSFPVALVNEDMVERYFDGEPPMGRRIKLGDLESPEPWLQIVGVVGNAFSGDPDNPSFPQMFVPMAQEPRRGMGLVLRPSGEPLAAVPSVREQVWSIDPDQPLGDVRTLSQIFDDTLATFDAIISIFGVFAFFALVMASTGIYGVMSFSVAQRTQEIGIRMALGAHGKDVMRMIRRQALWVVGIGLAVGSLAAAALSRVLIGTIQGLSVTDPWALAGVAVVLTGAAMLAIWVPARRAVRIDPIIALRQE